MRIFACSTCLEVSHQSLNPLLQVEDDETKSLSRVLSVTRSANSATVGLVVKNTASIGTARVQLDSNNATGLAKLEVSSASGCVLEAPGQEIGLQNRVTGQAPLIVEISGVITTAYGQNDLSDAKLKENIRDAEEQEMQSIFDRATPKRYFRKDADLEEQLGFLAQDFEGTGITGKTQHAGEELLTLNYGRLTAVLWGVCKQLQARVEALETKRSPKAGSPTPFFRRLRALRCCAFARVAGALSFYV